MENATRMALDVAAMAGALLVALVAREVFVDVYGIAPRDLVGPFARAMPTLVAATWAASAACGRYDGRALERTSTLVSVTYALGISIAILSVASLIDFRGSRFLFPAWYIGAVVLAVAVDRWDRRHPPRDT